MDDAEAAIIDSTSITPNTDQGPGHKSIFNTKGPHGVTDTIAAAATAASIAVASTAEAVITSLETAVQTQGETLFSLHAIAALMMMTKHENLLDNKLKSDEETKTISHTQQNMEPQPEHAHHEPFDEEQFTQLDVKIRKG